MTKLITLDHHYAINVTPNIQEICSPLFNFTLISFFNFVRIYKDGRRLSMGSNAPWLEHYFQKQYQNIAIFNYNNECLHKHYALHSHHQENEVIIDASQNYDICYGIVLIKPNDTYIDFYHYAANQKHTQAFEFYLNNLDLLEHFTLYFSDKAARLIKIAKPYVPEETASFSPQETTKTLTAREQFIKKTALKKFYLDPSQKDYYLTEQEISCLKHLVKSQTTKEAAKQMKLSPRTVEYYLTRLKKRFKIMSITQLFDILENNHISLQYLF